MDSIKEEKITGLSKEEVSDRVKKGLTNKTVLVVGKSVWEIIASNFLSLFNIVLYIIAGLLIFAGQWESLFFMGILLANVIIGLVEDLYARHLMKKMKIMTAATFKVLRDGQLIEVKSENIVQDDVVLMKESAQVPVDGRIIQGSLIVNESQITGESKTIDKNVGDELFSGSYVVGGTCYIVAEKVGNQSYIQQLSSKAKKFKRSPSKILRNLKILFRFISGIVISLAIAMAITYGVQGKYSDFDNVRNAIGSIAGSVVSMIPTGLYLLTSTTLAVGVITLAKKRASVQELYSIEMLARANVLCVDKTGTITDGTMSVTTIVGYVPYQENQIKQIVSNILNATKDTNLTAQALARACRFEPTLIATSVIPFTSQTKYSAASFGSKGTYIMGAIDFINLKNKEGILQRSREFTSKGQRVIALAHSDRLITGKTFEEECELISLIVLKDNVKPDALKTFQWFKDNGVDIKVISGDDAQTVSEIAKSVGISNAEKYISLHGLSDDEVKAAASEYNVFGRVSPEQKEVIVNRLKELGQTVAMTGDGVNDILALKRADCSIAMASGSEAARNVSHIVLLDSDFSRLPDIVGEGRRVINNLQRTASLFLTKTFFAVLLTVVFLVLNIINRNYLYPFRPNNMYIWDTLGIGIPSFFIALQPNREEINGDSFLKNVFRKAIPAGAVAVAMVLIFFTLYFLRINEIGYFGLSSAIYTGEGAFEGATVGYEQTVTMSVLAYSIFSVVVLYKVCSPLDKYRALVFAVTSVVGVGVLTGFIIYSYFGAMEQNFLKLGAGYLNMRNWLILSLVLVCATSLYLYVTYLVGVLRGRIKGRKNDKN